MEIGKKLLTYLIVFTIGGAFCLAAEFLLIKTKKLTPARIVVIFLLLGILLETAGVFRYIKEFAKSGATIPIVGFGASLAKGAIETARKAGFAGAFAGGLIKTAYGIGAAVFVSILVTLIFSPKSK